MKMLSEYVENDKFSGQLLIVSVTKGVTNNGLSYMTLELRDSSASIIAKKWEVTPEDEALFVTGNVIDVEGEIIFYKTSLQMKVLAARKVENDEIDLAKFLKVAPVEYEKLKEDLKYYLELITDKDLKAITLHILGKYRNAFLEYPAASSIHHDYNHGLLYHTVSMLKHAEHMIKYYGDLDASMVYAGIILHDVAKTRELEGPIVFKYSLEGKLLGHISMGYSEICLAEEELNIHNEKTLLLKHLVLSHHGQLEYGSPELPLTKEALLVHLIDVMDSKLTIAIKGLESVKEGEFSQKIFALDNRQLYKPNK